MSKTRYPAPPEVPLELWRELYAAATNFQELAPWRWMDDDHALGINNELGVRLVCTMGKLGQVFGLASYRGTAGTNFLVRMLLGEFDPETMDAAFYQDAVTVDFVPRKELRKSDKEVVEQLAFKPATTKPRLFPKFVSFKPGYFPWYVTESEARTMLDDLNKTARFAELVRSHPALFSSHGPDEFPFFPSSPTDPLTPDQFEWHQIAPSAGEVDSPVEPATVNAAAVASLPRASDTWEMTVFYSQNPITEGPRPYWPKLALVVESKTGMILGFHLEGPEQTMSRAGAEALVKAITAANRRPVAVKLDSLNILQALKPLGNTLHIDLAFSQSLPAAGEARDSFAAFGRL